MADAHPPTPLSHYPIVCHPPSTICHLLSAICYSLFPIRHLPPAVHTPLLNAPIRPTSPTAPKRSTHPAARQFLFASPAFFPYPLGHEIDDGIWARGCLSGWLQNQRRAQFRQPQAIGDFRQPAARDGDARGRLTEISDCLRLTELS